MIVDPRPAPRDTRRVMGQAEDRRLLDARAGKPWRKWGPYLSERQWGTVREDYSSSGDAWNHFPHDQARSRAYRWGEDGLFGISDDRQTLCFSVALHNGRDPILKERLFGLANEEGNHGEDVKEYYFYEDSTPTHSYMKKSYKYPQAAYPYADLVRQNARRGYRDPEYELIDTGVFDEDRYFDVTVEYAKVSEEDLLIRITAENRGPDAARLDLLPTIWFRNDWRFSGGKIPRPRLYGHDQVTCEHPRLGTYVLRCAGAPELLYTENETNDARLFGGQNVTPFVKDGINDHVVHGAATVNPNKEGTKAAARYVLEIGAQQLETVRLRLSRDDCLGTAAFDDFDRLLAERRAEADEYYDEVIDPALPAEERDLARQAFAGLLWTKQYFETDMARWISEHGGVAPRNNDWKHLRHHDVISMPDKWEYPWYATWDLAFHLIPLFLVDPDFAREQCLTFLSDRYQHEDGALPAYEWNYSDVNPPVLPFSVLTIHRLLKEENGVGDLELLERAFEPLVRNFEWWRREKNPRGDDSFGGGFLGLDNIGVFDRSKPLPTGGYLEQADANAWMLLFAQFMLQISLELTEKDRAYEEHALSFLRHIELIGAAMDRPGDLPDEMWDEEDGFFYDVLRYPDGSGTRLKVRSLVGLLPLSASTVIFEDVLERFPRLREKCVQMLGESPESRHCTLIEDEGRRGKLLSPLDETKLRRVLARMLDEDEFLSPHGIRSLSKFHAAHPYHYYLGDQTYGVGYLPGESDSGMFGGNSNWRGPVWMPTNFLLIRALVHLHEYFGDDFVVEYPTRSGHMANLRQVASELSRRIERPFLKDADGRRPVYGGTEKFQSDPAWNRHILFYEYFHGDDGSGIGASHQTGWTGLVAASIVQRGRRELIFSRLRSKSDLPPRIR